MFKQKRMLLVFLMPGLAGMLLFYLAPFLYGIYFSVTDGSYLNIFVGLQNYRAVWQNEMFQLGLKNTLELSFICAPLVFAGSFFIAVILRTINKKTTIYRSVLLLPHLIPSAAVLMIFLLLFDYGGLLNRILSIIELPHILWKESHMMRVPVVVLYVWKNIGFSVVIFSSAMQSVPTALYEYADLEGASRFRQEISITMPFVLPTAFLVFVLSWINAFKIFKDVYFISGAYPDPSCYTLQHFMNNQFSRFNYQYVTTAAYSFAAIVIVLFGILAIIETRRRVLL